MMGPAYLIFTGLNGALSQPGAYRPFYGVMAPGCECIHIPVASSLVEEDLVKDTILVGEPK